MNARSHAIVPPVVLCAALAWQASALAQGTVQDDPRRPPPPQPTPGCEIWEGTIVGNDPSAVAYFQLCGETGVGGVFLFTSLRSGWSRHRVSGIWNAPHTHIDLRDLAMEESHPIAGWRLCPADFYHLTITRPGHIDGTFDSAECADHGQITLDLTTTEAPQSPPRLPPPPLVAPQPERPRRGLGRRFACAVDGGPGATVASPERAIGGRGTGVWGGLWVAALAAGISARRRTPGRR